MRRFTVSLPLVVATLLYSSRGHTQEAAAAEALFDSGRAAIANGDFSRACEQFRESGRLDPAVGTDFNLADCEEKRGRLATAWELFVSVEQRLPPGDERIDVAERRAQALEARVPKLTLRLAPGAPLDSTVRDGKVALGAATLGVALPLDPGRHEFVVSAPGRAPRRFEITLAEGDARVLDVTPGALANSAIVSESPPDARDAASIPHDSSRHSSTRTLGFVLGGVGVAGLGAGAVTGLMVLGKKSTLDASCDARKVCSQAGVDAAQSGRTLEIVSTVGWIVGAVGLGAGAYFVLTSGTGEARTVAGIAPIPAGAQLSVTRNF